MYEYRRTTEAMNVGLIVSALPQSSLFIASIFRLFNSLMQFFSVERSRSSSEMLINVIEEWDNVFAKDVNLVLLKAFVGIVNAIGSHSFGGNDVAQWF